MLMVKKVKLITVYGAVTSLILCAGFMVYNHQPNVILQEKEFTDDELLIKNAMLDENDIPVVIQQNREIFQKVVYNRVGKCGSRSMQNIIKVLADQQKFNFYISPVSNDTRPKMLDLSKEVKLISNLQTPALYSRHIHYINFAKFGELQPVYINMIRDPIERFSSQYHFKRYGDFISKKQRGGKTLTEGQRNMNINDCILRNHSDCMGLKLWYIIPYFCGQDPICRLPSVEGLRRAKMHVLDNYLAVGVLEDFNGTLKVFEKLLPDYFTGASSIWSGIVGSESSKTSTRGKQTLSREAYEVLKERLAYEYDFYNFVYNIYKNLKVQLNIS